MTRDARHATSDAPAADARTTLTHQAVVGRGRRAFENAAAGLLSWRMHRLAGVRVDSSAARIPAPPAEPALRVTVGLGPAALALGGGCVVERVVRGTDHVAMTYRTEPGHPEDGVQTFDVLLTPDGEVRGRITSASVPAHPVLRAAPALGRLGQRVVARRYLRALRRLAAG